MAENIKGEHLARIGGVDRRLRLGIDEMIGIEAALGVADKGGVYSLLNAGLLSYTAALTIIHFALQGAGVKQDVATTRAQCQGMGVAELHNAALGAINAAQPEKTGVDGKNGAAPGAAA